MILAPFLRSEWPMHWEHIEHHSRHRTIRLEMADLPRTTVVIRCRGIGRIRVRLALWIMRVAARVGGFKTARLTRED